MENRKYFLNKPDQVVWIGGMPITTKFVRTSSTSAYHAYLGDSSFDSLEMRIATINSTGEPRHILVLEETLMHEIVHHIGEIYKIEMDERETDAMAQGLVQVLGQFGVRLIGCSEGLEG